MMIKYSGTAPQFTMQLEKSLFALIVGKSTIQSSCVMFDWLQPVLVTLFFTICVLFYFTASTPQHSFLFCVRYTATVFKIFYVMYVVKKTSELYTWSIFAIACPMLSTSVAYTRIN